MLDTSNEISRRYSPEQLDDQANVTCVTNEQVSAEHRKDQVEQWLHGVNTQIPDGDILLARGTENNQQISSGFASLVPLLKVLFSNGVPDEVRGCLPDALKNELDKIIHLQAQPLSPSAAAGYNESNAETITQQKEDSSKDLKQSQPPSNPTVTEEVKKKEWAMQDCTASKEDQEIPLDSMNLECDHDESDKLGIITDDSLLHNHIAS